MSNGSLARRYAKALFQIGKDENNLTTLGEEIGAFAQLMHDSNELVDTLVHPAFPKSERKGIVVRILETQGACSTVMNFCKILMDKERVEHLPEISRELDVLIRQQEGRSKAIVKSAETLTQDQINSLGQRLEKLAGSQVDIETEVDASLLGGVVATIGDMVYDGSLKTQLQKLKDNRSR